MELVAGCREHVDVVVYDIDRDMTYCLYSICMECNIVTSADLTDFTYRLDRSDLIICIHDGYKACILTDSVCNLLGSYKSVLMNIEKGYFEAFLFELS